MPLQPTLSLSSRLKFAFRSVWRETLVWQGPDSLRPQLKFYHEFCMLAQLPRRYCVSFHVTVANVCVDFDGILTKKFLRLSSSIMMETASAACKPPYYTMSIFKYFPLKYIFRIKAVGVGLKYKIKNISWSARLDVRVYTSFILRMFRVELNCQRRPLV